MYLFAYYKTLSQRLYYAASLDGLRWSTLRDGEPVLRARLGSQSVRDPFIVDLESGLGAGPDGTRYVLLCSDGDGSNGIHVWRGTDLWSWEDERLPAVMPRGDRVKAPKAFYHEAEGRYLVIWAASRGASPSLIWGAYTQDFRRYEPARELYAPGYSVSDPFILFDPGSQGSEYYLFFQDGRGSGWLSGQRAVRCLRSGSPTCWPAEARATAALTGPGVGGPVVVRANGRWRLYCDPYRSACRAYAAYECLDLDRMYRSYDPRRFWHRVPFEVAGWARHGCVLPVDVV